MRRLFTYFGIAMLLTGCVEEVDQFQPLELTSGNINRFFEAVQSNPIPISWDASQEKLITLPGYGRVIVPPNAFLLPDGSEVSGMVQAKVLDLYSKEDLLRNRITTASANGIVESAGTVFIEVEQGGQQLRLKPDELIRIQMATARYNSQMRLFTGKAGEDGTLEWVEYSLSEAPVRSVELEDPESGQLVPGFEFSSPELGYLKCGTYLSEEQGTAEVCLNLPYNFDAKNTVAFIALRDYNGLTTIPFEEENALRPDCCRDGLPTGEPAKIIVIAEGEEGMYFLEEKTVTIMENLTISITPEAASLSDIMLALEGL
jgi:hypothetical protein